MNRAGRTVALGLALLAALLCVRLGFWQIARLHEKRRLNAEMAAALAAPPLEVRGTLPELEAARGRRVRVSGRFDERRQVLIANRSRAGSPGVEVVTPLRLEGGRGAVLVDRGWLYAADGASARPEKASEPGRRTVLGIPIALRRGAGGPSPRRLTADSLTLWSVSALDLDSLSRSFPYPLASYALRELPGPGVPERPARSAPRPLDEWTHVNYAGQWFLFAAILLFGPAVLAWSRRGGAAGAADLVIPPRPSTPHRLSNRETPR